MGPLGPMGRPANGGPYSPKTRPTHGFPWVGLTPEDPAHGGPYRGLEGARFHPRYVDAKVFEFEDPTPVSNINPQSMPVAATVDDARDRRCD
jgi:hypothetical protein